MFDAGTHSRGGAFLFPLEWGCGVPAEVGSGCSSKMDEWFLVKRIHTDIIQAIISYDFPHARSPGRCCLGYSLVPERMSWSIDELIIGRWIPDCWQFISVLMDKLISNSTTVMISSFSQTRLMENDNTARFCSFFLDEIRHLKAFFLHVSLLYCLKFTFHKGGCFLLSW